MPLSRTAMFANPFGPAVAFLSMTGRETMGRPFSFEVDLLSDSDSLDLKEILAKPASVVLERLDGTLREFNGLVTELAKGKDMYFRFYDPRVLRVFLPTCTPDELSDFFGPIGSFLIESDQPAHAWLCSREPGYPLRLQDLAL